MSWSFGDLNLSGVKAASSESGLKPGYYLCRIEHAEVKQASTKKGFFLSVKFKDVASGSITYDNITLVHQNNQAQEIGQARLKLLLETAGHPNPNNPGSVEKIKGLHVGVAVDEGDDYTDKTTGEKKKGMPKPRKNGPYFKPEEQGFEVPQDDQGGFDLNTNDGSGDPEDDDDIPF